MNNEFNENVRPQDDLYNYVNGKWLEKAKIPADQSSTGGFIDLDNAVEKTMIKELKSLSKKEVKDPLLNKAVTLFKKVEDEESKKKGTEYLLNKVDYLDTIKSKEDFSRAFYYMYDNNYPLPIQLGVSEDMEDATHYSLIATSPSIILPDTTMYETERGKALLDVFKKMMVSILDRLNVPNSSEIAAKAMSFDEKISKIVKSQEEWVDYIKFNNPYALDKFASLVNFDFLGFVASRFGKLPSKVVVYDPRYFDNYLSLMEGNINEFVAWAKVMLIKQNFAYLGEEERKLASTYSMALTGAKGISSLDKYAYRLVDK